MAPCAPPSGWISSDTVFWALLACSSFCGFICFQLGRLDALHRVVDALLAETEDV